MRSSEYNSWRAMIARCENPNHSSYANYRGIRVCARWRLSFRAFLMDMGPRPPGTSLDRINPELGYEPANCRWASNAVQASNKRRKEMVGIRVGRLVVTHPARTRSDGRARWWCQCVCGAVVEVDGKSLRSGNTRSCGCLSRDKASQRMKNFAKPDRPRRG